MAEMMLVRLAVRESAKVGGLGLGASCGGVQCTSVHTRDTHM